jgi:hypothetical protein
VETDEEILFYNISIITHPSQTLLQVDDSQPHFLVSYDSYFQFRLNEHVVIDDFEL